MTEQAPDWRSGGFGIYVHWPFCAAKCPYCDFNSHVRSGVDQTRWRAALIHEIRRIAAEVPGREVDTVFFGGGTPSLMPPETVGAVLETVAACWPVAPDAEVTLEANPTSVETGRFTAYRAAGVNRVSMGIQSFNDGDLKALGRLHSVSEARRAFETARSIFPRVSFDLIYARQGQTLGGWRDELREALAMCVDHLSLYQLTVEAGTRFGDLADRGRLRGLPDDDTAADMYLLTQEVCAAAGFEGYEISNYARPGAESRHNLIYWRYGDYAGIGPGAHGRLTVSGTRTATETYLRPEEWLAAVERDGNGTSLSDPVAPEDQAVEMLMMGLRLREGIDLRRYTRLAGAPPARAVLAALADSDLVSREGTRLRVTERGRPLLDAVLRELLAG